MMLSSLVEVAGSRQLVKMKVARMLACAYVITPIMLLSVVVALKACEAVQHKRGQSVVHRERVDCGVAQ